MSRILVFVVCLVFSLPAFANNVRLVQQELQNRGYPVGKIDGKFGRITAAAIEQYERDWQIKVTGKIDDELIARLQNTHDDTKPQLQRIGNSKCELFNAFPKPRETVTYVSCDAQGPVSGTGKIIWRWYEQGDWQRAKYEGELDSGKLHGTGTLSYPNGGSYKGEFKQGKRHGKGLREWPRGNSYDGNGSTTNLTVKVPIFATANKLPGFGTRAA